MPSLLSTLPPEVILEIIPHIPFSHRTLASLCLTCSRFNDLVRTHEQSLVRAIKQQQFTPTDLLLFPGLSQPGQCCLSTITISSSSTDQTEPAKADEQETISAPRIVRMALPHAHTLGPQDFAELTSFADRLANLDQTNNHWLKIVNHGIELHWLKSRWETIHKAGLLLLYRMQDTGHRPSSSSFPSSPFSPNTTTPSSIDSYIAQTTLLHSLPALSLACLLFKLLSSIKILRVFGPSPINSAWNRASPALRSDVELACEELLLTHGPSFFTALLRAGTPANAGAEEKRKSEWAVAALQHETAQVLPRQLPYASGEAKPPTLLCSLRRALAWKTGCAPQAATAKMWELLSSEAFEGVGEEGVAALVLGLGG